MLVEENSSLMSLDDFRAEVASEDESRPFTMKRDQQRGGWKKVYADEVAPTPAPESVAESAPTQRDGRFVLDVTYQDRPDLHPHMPDFTGRVVCEEFFD